MSTRGCCRPRRRRRSTPRSFMRVVSATVQPWFTSPSRWSSRHAHVGEEHLVERRAAGHLAQRTHLDTRRVHVDDEAGEALVLRHVGVGAADDLADVAVLRAGRPDLLAVDDPLVAVALGPRLQTREVAARARLAEQLAGHDVAPPQRLQVSVLRVVGAVGQDRRRHHAEPDAEEALVRDVVLAFQRLPRAFIGLGELAAAVRGGPADPAEAGVELLLSATPVPSASSSRSLLRAFSSKSVTLSEPSPQTNFFSSALSDAFVVEERRGLGLELLERDVGHALVPPVRAMLTRGSTYRVRMTRGQANVIRAFCIWTVYVWVHPDLEHLGRRLPRRSVQGRPHRDLRDLGRVRDRRVGGRLSSPPQAPGRRRLRRS